MDLKAMQERPYMTKNRLETFIDGVFAIVITLLVLELRPEQAGLQAREMIIHTDPKILAFVLSFVIIGTYRVAHYRMLHFMKYANRTLLWLNLALYHKNHRTQNSVRLWFSCSAETNAVRLEK